MYLGMLVNVVTFFEKSFLVSEKLHMVASKGNTITKKKYFLLCKQLIVQCELIEVVM